MNSIEKLDLKKLVNEMEAEDNTENIRKLKHSTLIRDDIRRIGVLKGQYPNKDDLLVHAQNECQFLFTNYTDIFNRLMKDELDLDIMTRLLIILKLIEDGKVDQHEGSVMVGKILKELYIDSALKSSENIDKQYAEQAAPPPKVAENAISWQEWKMAKILMEKYDKEKKTI
jgi:hypothetical protein